MQARRICFIGWADHVHLERWAGYFAAHDDAVSLISHSDLGRYPPGVKQSKIGLQGRGPRWHALRLRYLIWRHKPDLVHVHWAHFAVAARKLWAGPLVVTAWGSDIYRRSRFTDAQWAGLGQCLRSAELVTCDSEDLAKVIRTEFAVEAARVVVIQWGVDTEIFKPEGNDLRDQLGLQGKRVVLSARNFTPVYNQETVVRAFALLHARRCDTFLLMKCHGGDPAYLTHIRTLIEQLGLSAHVKILDSVPYEQMADLYRTADVTVSVPHSDATPMALLEAMACGSPCVVCDLPSLREWVEDGVTGYLVQGDSPSEIADAVERCLAADESTRSIRTRAREMVVSRASQHLHMAAASERYSALLKDR